MHRAACSQFFVNKMEFRPFHEYDYEQNFSEFYDDMYPRRSSCDNCCAIQKGVLSVRTRGFWDRIIEDSVSEGVDVWGGTETGEGQKEGGWWDRNDSGSSGFDESLSDSDNEDVYREVLCLLEQKAQKVRRETVILRQAENTPRVSPQSYNKK